MALANAGFHTAVYSRDPEPNRRADLVRSFGADYASSTTEPVDRLAQRLGRIDLVYEAVGVSKFSFDVAQHLAPNGAFIFTGVPALRGGSSIDTDTLMRNLVLKNQLLLGSVNAGRDAFEGAIEHLGVFARRWPAALRSLITGRFPVTAYKDLLLGKPAGIKNVITFNGSH
jgi:threonine dehydrogenase-like Zn-dependent dehydrogenase